MPAKPRRYIGFTLSSSDEDTIVTIRNPHIQGNVKRPLRPHITLIPPAMMEILEDEFVINTLDDVLGDYSAFSVQNEGPADFDKRLVYLQLENTQIGSLQKDLMRSLGFDEYFVKPVGQTGYVPHITLLQSPVGTTLPENVLKALYVAQWPKEFYLNSVHLKELVPGAGYIDRAVIELP